MFRCTVDGKKLEQVARGFWNPFGVCVDKWGRIFAVDNDPGNSPPCRLLHVVQNGDYGYRYKYGRTGIHPFLAWDGGSRWALGYADKASLAELAAALAAQPVTQLEITTALNLDGGRSSDLWVSAEVPGGPLNTRTLWNRPVRNYLLLHRQSR